MITQTLAALKDDPSLQGHEALYAAIALDAALKRYGYTDYQVSVYGRTKSHGIRFFNGGDNFHPVVFVVHGEDEFHLQADVVCTLLGRLESMPRDEHNDMLEMYLAYECDVFYEYYERTSDKFRVFHELQSRCPDTFELMRHIGQDALKRINMGDVDGPQPYSTVKDALNGFNALFLAARQNIRQRRKKEAKTKSAKGKAECK